MNGDLLIEAHTLVNGQRQKDYGRPENSFRRIAELWSAYLGAEVTGKDVALMMALLKLSREQRAQVGQPAGLRGIRGPWRGYGP